MAGERLGTTAYAPAIHTLSEKLRAEIPSALAVGTTTTVSVQANIALNKNWLLERMIQPAALSCTALWMPAGGKKLWVGFGEAEQVSVARGEPLHQIAASYRAQTAHWQWQPCQVKPKWFGGFAFRSDGGGSPWQDWPGAKLVLPTFQLEVSLQTGHGEHGLMDAPEVLDAVITYSCRVHPEDACDVVVAQLDQNWSLLWADTDNQNHTPRPSSPSPSQARALDEAAWSRAVLDSAEAIRAHHLRKVVLARLQLCDVPDKGAAVWLPNLLRADASATAFLITHGADAFIGASPERLVRVTDGEVAVDCLAGSRQRGLNPQADEELGQALLNSRKDQSEHRVVVDWVTSKLQALTSTIDMPEQPHLKKMATVQHLYTPVRGQLYDGVDALDVAFALHPTPAVAGDPVDLARTAIASHEPVDRGWYAGSVGTIDADGDGEFVVALRSALVQGDKAVLYAGAGIMADSEPHQEWQETNWKLRPMQRVMGCDEERDGDA